MRKLFAALSVIVALAGCSSHSSHHTSAPSTQALTRQANLPACPSPGKPAVGKTLPDLTLPCMNPGGGKLMLTSLTGTPTVLNLWAQWCDFCTQEMSAVHQTWVDGRGAFRLIGIDSEDTPSASLPFIADYKPGFANAADSDGTLKSKLGIGGLPATVYLRSDGSIAYIHAGPITAAQLRSELAGKLGVHVAG